MRRYLRWLVDNTRGVRGALVMNIIPGLLSVGCTLAFVWVCKHLVDLAVGGADAGDLIMPAVVMCLLQLARIGFNALGTRYESITFARLGFRIRANLFSSILQSQWEGKEKMHSGDALNRIFSDVDTVTKVISQDLPSMVITLFKLVAAVAFMAILDWRLAAVIVLVTPFLLLFSKLFFRRMRQMTMDIRNTESSVQTHIQESIQNKILLQSMEMGAEAERDLSGLQNQEYGQIMRRTWFNIWSKVLLGITFGTGYTIAFLWGIHGLWDGSVTFGVMTAFLQLVAQIQHPALHLTHQIPSFVYASASIDRLMELSDGSPEESGEPQKLSSPAGLRIEDVYFRYPDGDKPVFDGFSHDFKPGSRTAIVGRTGVGKSTLIRLMLSLLRPQGGSLRVYDSNEEIPCGPRTRVNFSYVPQGNSLFSGTIRANLQLGDPSADEEAMTKALRTAAAEFVFDLPEGLDTMCGEKGAGLSEGQAQRIAVARGLLRPGSILLMDEFSSSLDSETEDRLIKNLVSEHGDKTMIFITHRGRITDFCDDVIRMK